jgi:hypothetical protein
MSTQFQCQGCGALLEFDPRLQGLKCEYCGSVEAIEVEHKAAEEHDILSAPKTYGWGLELKAVGCESCGATISSDTSLAGACSFCDSPYVREIPANPDIIRPETMVPFKISRDNAMALFRRWIGRGWFRPSNLKQLARPEKFRGIYTPFWTYDCTTHSDWSAMSGYYYYVKSGKAMVRRVRWTPSSGSRNGIYDDILILASKGLDESLVSDIQPFHLNQLESYKAEFMAGWQAEEYVIGLPEGWMKAQWIIHEAEKTKCARAVPGDTHRALTVNTQLDNVKYKHILLPIWISAYRYKEKTFRFLINGQTGEVQGEAPISWPKVGAVVAVVTGIAAGVFYYLWSQGMI